MYKIKPDKIYLNMHRGGNHKVLTIKEAISQLMAIGRRVNFFSGFGSWEASHALVKDPVTMHIWAVLSAFSGRFTKERIHEIGSEKW